jgi:uncharacterized protein involved in outer membrane biogenesis
MKEREMVMKKWILRGVAGLIVLLVVLSVALAFSLGSIVKKGVERIGPEATKVDVRLKGAEVWLLGGRVQLSGFFLGNPAGYKLPAAMEVDSVSVRVKAGTVFSDKLVVDEINIKKPVITIEGGLKDNNLTRIEKNLDDYMDSGTPGPAANAAPGTPSPTNAERKLQVNELVISGAKLQINTTLSGGKTIVVPIPEIHLTGLGAGPEGITPVEVSQRVLKAILSESTKEMAKNLSNLGKEAYGEAAGEAKKLDTKKIGDKLKGLFQ